MTREEFLSSFWRPYPAAQSQWLDVRSFLESTDQESSKASSSFRVGGRLRRVDEQVWLLSSAGAQIQIRFVDECQWMPFAMTRETRFSDLFLRDGDVVSAELRSDSERASEPVVSVYNCVALALLTPRRTKSVPESRFTIERSEQWSDFLTVIRNFFKRRRFTEAATPTLVPSPGTEPFLDPFVTTWHWGGVARDFYLPTSPEFHLKKMLCQGWTKIFELKSCFRNGEISSHHQPEFTMLEWYRAYGDLNSIADDVEALFECIAEHVGPEQAMPRLRRVTMSELFAETFAGFQLTPTTSREELIELAHAHEVVTEVSDSWDDVFFRIFLQKIEGDLGHNGPILVKDYPPSQAALSRIGENGFADRFEVYWKGLELANAFHELTDPDENEVRFLEDARKKAELGKSAVPVDQELIQLLRSGMPPSGGIALGVDRLFMAFYEISEIEEARAFPVRVHLPSTK